MSEKHGPQVPARPSEYPATPTDKTKHSHGMYVRSRPRSHPLSQHQLDLVEASASCGIKKGITRDELVDKMVNCVPEAYRKLKEEREHGTESD